MILCVVYNNIYFHFVTECPKSLREGTYLVVVLVWSASIILFTHVIVYWMSQKQSREIVQPIPRNVLQILS